MKTVNKLTAAILIAILTISCGIGVMAADTPQSSTASENTDHFALVVTEGVSFQKQGEAATGSISKGSGLVLGGSVELRSRSIVNGENKLYYKDGAGITFTVVDPDQWATKPSVYCWPTMGEYAIHAPALPEFQGGNLTSAGNLTVGSKSVIVSQDSYFESVDVSGNGCLVFEVPESKTLFVRIDDLMMNSSGYNRGSIQVTGGGTVFLSVDNLLGEKNKYINYPNNGAIDWQTYQLKTENRLVLSVENSSNSTLTGLLVEGDIYFKNSVTLDQSFKICGNVVASGDLIYTGENRKPTEEFNVLGQVYAPNGIVRTTGAARIRGQLIAKNAQLYGNTILYYHDFHYVTVTPNKPIDIPDEKPDIDVGENVRPEYPERPDRPEVDPSRIRVVEYQVDTGTYASGTMKTKVHTPLGLDVSYEVLDESSFVPDGKEIPSNAVQMIQLIRKQTEIVFDLRKLNVSLAPFGRVDSEAYQYALTISPYVVPLLTQYAPEFHDMWLVWADGNGKIEKIWLVTE